MVKIPCGSVIRRSGAIDAPGTGGCLVRFPALPDCLLMLTAGHVLVGSTAKQFDPVEARELPGNPFGVLLGWTSLKGEITTDIALVQVDPALVEATIGTLGPPRGINLDPVVSQTLRTFAMGQVRSGVIRQIGATRPINVIGPDFSATVQFEGQILCDSFSAPGFSGAVALDDDNKVVGVIVAGDGAEFTLVTPIDAVLNHPDWGQAGALEVLGEIPSEARAPEPPHPAPPPPPISADPTNDGAALSQGIAWGGKVEPEFKRAVISMCQHLGIDPNHMMACMAFETGARFTPDVTNPVSGATGLIQFIPSTAQTLGTSTAALAQMAAVQQLKFVEKYFQPHSGMLKTLSDVYMALLWPKAVGKLEGFVLFKAPSKAYAQNKGLDSDNDGKVTKAEAANRVHRMLVMGMTPDHFG